MDDLQRVLGYLDAADPALTPDTEPSVLGQDLLVVPFWTPEFCRALIRAAEAVGAFEPQPDDPVPGHEVSLAVISPKLYAAVEMDLGRRRKFLEDANALVEKDRQRLPIVAVGSAWAMQKDKVTIKPRVDEDALAMNIKPK